MTYQPKYRAAFNEIEEDEAAFTEWVRSEAIDEAKKLVESNPELGRIFGKNCDHLPELTVGADRRNVGYRITSRTSPVWFHVAYWAWNARTTSSYSSTRVLVRKNGTVNRAVLHDMLFSYGWHFLYAAVAEDARTVASEAYEAAGSPGAHLNIACDGRYGDKIAVIPYDEVSCQVEYRISRNKAHLTVQERVAFADIEPLITELQCAMAAAAVATKAARFED